MSARSFLLPQKPTEWQRPSQFPPSMGRCHIQESSRSSQRHQCFFELGNGSRLRPWQSSPVLSAHPGYSQQFCGRQMVHISRPHLARGEAKAGVSSLPVSRPCRRLKTARHSQLFNYTRGACTCRTLSGTQAQGLNNWIVEAAWCARFSETQTTGEPMPLRAAGP